MTGPQITCAKCGKKEDRRGMNHKLCRVCGREVRNAKSLINFKLHYKPTGRDRGNPHATCTPITLDEYYAIERVVFDRGATPADIDEMVGKKGTQYLTSLHTRLRDFGHAQINTEIKQAIDHWIDSGTD